MNTHAFISARLRMLVLGLLVTGTASFAYVYIAKPVKARLAYKAKIEAQRAEQDRRRHSSTWMQRARKAHKAGNAKKAYQYTENAAKLGYKPAIHTMANAYEHGEIGLPRSLKSAEHWYREIGSEAHESFLFRLARTLSSSSDVDEQTRVFGLIQAAANRGSETARLELAGLYESGIGVEKDHAKADAIKRDLINTGQDSNVVYRVARNLIIYGSIENVDRGVETLTRLADEGSEPAAEYLAEIYFKPYRVEQSYEKAAEYYAKAERLSGKNRIRYANLLRVGQGTQKDVDQAFSILQSAAELGNYDAKNHLGYIYRFGIGTPSDIKKAKQQFASDDYGVNYYGQYYLGCMYESGELGSPDYEKAAELYQQAEENNVLGAGYALGRLYERGLGVEKNPERAFSLVKKDADRDYVPAEWTLSNYYSRGFGVNKSDEISEIIKSNIIADPFILPCQISDAPNN